ncbi:MAG: hypothetical protein GYB67_15440 [Chloroflexi bacterium]|nr:hypothetical protein [Chloroflexota bacterium]
MPVRLDWQDAAHTILCFEYLGRWTWQEFKHSAREGQEMALSVPQRIAVIADLTNGPFVPDGAFGQVDALTRDASAHWQLVVIVGSTPTITALLRAFKRVYREAGQTYLVADTIEDALNLIEEHRRQNTAITPAPDTTP